MKNVKSSNPKKKLTEKQFIENYEKAGFGMYDVKFVSKNLNKFHAIEELLGADIMPPTNVSDIKKRKYICNTKTGQLKKALTLSEILKRKDVVSVEKFKIQI